MIHYNYRTDFSLTNEVNYSIWIERILLSEGKDLGEIEYFFVDDDTLLDLNETHLQHDTFTDIITFDYVVHNLIQGDIFISIDRVKDNAKNLHADFHNELLRVMAHGLLHLCGYADKSVQEEKLMRQKEEEKIQMFHVKR